MNMLIKSLLTTNRVGDPIYQGNNITTHHFLPIELPDEVWELANVYVTSTTVSPRYYMNTNGRLTGDVDDGYCETGVDTTLTISIDNTANCARHPDSRFTKEFLWEFTFVNADDGDVWTNLSILLKKHHTFRRVLTLFCLHCE